MTSEHIQDLQALLNRSIDCNIWTGGQLPMSTFSPNVFGIAPPMRRLELRISQTESCQDEFKSSLRDWRPIAGPKAIDAISLNGETLSLDANQSDDSDVACNVIDASDDAIFACFAIDSTALTLRVPAGAIAIRSANLNKTVFSSIAPVDRSVDRNCISRCLRKLLRESCNNGMYLVVAAMESGDPLGLNTNSWNVWQEGEFIGGASLVAEPFSVMNYKSIAMNHHALDHVRLIKMLLDLDVLSFERFARLSQPMPTFEIVTQLILDAHDWNTWQLNRLRHAGDRLYRRLFPSHRFQFQFRGESNGV